MSSRFETTFLRTMHLHAVGGYYVFLSIAAPKGGGQL